MTNNDDSTSPTPTASESSTTEEQSSGNEVTDTTADSEELSQPEPAFGWTAYAEQINGRFAMIGFVLLLILEAVTGQTFFTWLGLR